jgi:hypothetical protein
MEGKDFGLPGPDGAGQPGQLRDPDAVCPAVKAVQGGAGRRRTDRSIDGAQQLLALPGGRHLTARVTDSKPSPQPRPSSLGELLGQDRAYSNALCGCPVSLDLVRPTLADLRRSRSA